MVQYVLLEKFQYINNSQKKHIFSILEERGNTTIKEIETAAGDEYTLYLQVLSEMIDNSAVAIEGDKIKRR